GRFAEHALRILNPFLDFRKLRRKFFLQELHNQLCARITAGIERMTESWNLFSGPQMCMDHRTRALSGLQRPNELFCPYRDPAVTRSGKGTHRGVDDFVKIGAG